MIETVDFGISAQVLQEFFVTMTRKLRVRMSPDEALAWIENLEAFPCLPVDAAVGRLPYTETHVAPYPPPAGTLSRTLSRTLAVP